ncbi:hypothetical protein J0H58_16440 [bacterium]|nr:hypothetical protein [bacterium]
MRTEETEQPPPSGEPVGAGPDSALHTPHAALPTEPATSFKWVIVAGVVVWGLGAAIIVWSRFISQ